MNRAVTTHVNGELLQITATVFRGQNKIIAVLLNIVVLPVAGLIAGNQHKRRVAGRIFQPGGGSLLNKRVIEPQRFAVGNQHAFIRLGHMPVEQIWSFDPQVALPVLHGVAAAVRHFLRKAGVEAAHFIKAAF